MGAARAPTSVRVRVAEVVVETADAISIVFDGDGTSYRPGQYLTLRVPSERTGSVARCYSLASSPDRDERPRVIVKRTAGGYASNWLCDHVAAGDEIEVLPPAGVFVPSSLDEDVLLFAGGSGITPVLSIATSVLAAGAGRVTLFYANRDEASVIGAATLRELEAEFGDRLSVVHWLESLQGLPGADALVRAVERHPEHRGFVCGPASFMDAVREAWRVAGRDRRSLQVETFTSLTGNPFEGAPAEIAPEPVESGEGSVAAEVELEGEVHRFDWPKGVRLLDHMLDIGIEAPYMCRDGECGTCAAVCTGGSVRMVGNNLLEARDVEAGDVLTCQLVPDGDGPVSVVF